jgi:AsmA protein
MRRSTVILGTAVGAVLVAVALFTAARVHAVATAAADAVARPAGASLAYSGWPGISLWPATAVTFDNVVITAESSPLVTAAQMRLNIDRGLFAFRQPAITSAMLTEAHVNMAIGKDGKANWVFTGKQDQELGSRRGLPVRLVNSTLAFRDERSGFRFTVDEIEADSQFGGLDGEFSAKGGVVWNKQPVSFSLFLKSPHRLAEDGSPIDLNLSSPSLTLALSGRAATAKTFDLSGQATVKSDNVRTLAQWFGSKLTGDRGLQKFEVTGNFEASERGVSFRKAQLSLDGMRGQGDVGIGRVNGKLALDAELGLDRINLATYLVAGLRVPVLTLLEDRWSTDTLSFESLKSIDARLRLAANEIIYGDLKSGPTRVVADLSGGVLDIKLDKLSLYGGAANARIRLDGSGAVPALAIAFSGSNLDSEPALRGAMSFGKIAGRLATSFSVTSLGSSVAEMVSRLKGSGTFRITDGKVIDMDVVTMIRRATETIEDGWPRDSAVATPFDALSASYTVEDGIVATQNLVLSSPELAVTLRGEIDLARQALDLASDPRIAEKKGAAAATKFATLPVPIIVKGPWIGPRIYPDMPGILDDPGSAFRALKKLGLGTATVETSAAPAN